MPQPSDLQAQVNSIQWTNGQRLITGAFLLSIFSTIFGVLSGMGTWTNGSFTINASALSNVLPNISTNVEGTTYTPGIDGGAFMFWNAPTSPTGPFAQNPTVRIDRHENYTGAAGSIEQALQVNCSQNNGITNYSWCTLISLDNYGQGANNVGLYVSSHRRPGALSTWGSAIEADDFDANSSAAVIGQELDLYATGAPATNNRIIQDIVGGFNALISGATNPTIYAGQRIGAQNGVTGNATFIHGLTFNSGTFTSVISADPASGYATNFTHGVDLSRGTCTSGGDLFKGAAFIATCAGAIGIGNTSPQVALDIYGGSASPQIRITGSGLADLRMSIASGPGVIGTFSANDLVLFANGVEQARAISGGGFGVKNGLALTPTLISGLGTCNGTNVGMVKFVQDSVGAAAPTWHGQVAGGGSNNVFSIVSCNGAYYQYE